MEKKKLGFALGEGLYVYISFSTAITSSEIALIITADFGMENE